MRKQPTGGADRKAKHVAEHSRVNRIPCADPARRAALEADPVAWLRHYLAAAYARPFERPHMQIIDGALAASRTGGRFAVAAQRGIGKSTLEWGLVLYLSFTGKQRFPVCVPWSKAAIKRAFRFWRAALCFNPALAADYPEICAPFVHAKGVSQRLASTTWRDTGEPTGAALQISDGLIILPDCRGCFGGESINGNPRGLNHSQTDGTVLRPSLALIDDVQDRDVAKSAAMIRDTIDLIDGDVGGLGEAGKDFPLVMSGNCILPDDVMAHYLAADGWVGVRVPCVEAWPKDWGGGDGPTAKLWNEWYARWKDDDEAADFYAVNRERMTAGMALTAPETYGANAKDGADVYQAVMIAYHRMGRAAFAAEYQQDPQRPGVEVYDLRVQDIIARTDPARAAGVVPDWAREIVAATDINRSYALTSVLVAFGADQRAGVLWYGTEAIKISESWTPAQQRAAIMEALAIHGKNTIAKLPAHPSLWAIDAGGSPTDTVIDFAALSLKNCGVQAVAAFGRAAKMYRLSPQRAGRRIVPHEESHAVIESMGRRWIIYNACHWREQAQRGWTGMLGGPGSCELPAGNHREFAEQVARERLIGKADMGAGMRWEWKTDPGPHDFGDCMHMAYMLAAVKGIGAAGARVVRRVVGTAPERQSESPPTWVNAMAGRGGRGGGGGYATNW